MRGIFFPSALELCHQTNDPENSKFCMRACCGCAAERAGQREAAQQAACKLWRRLRR